ncbi:hypothetical protein JCM16163A_50180 [Paenibacillus sp. YK5]
MLKSKFLKGFLATAIVVSSVALAPLENANAVENPTSFSDISGHWAESQIKAAVAEGYVSGYQDGTFKPSAEITRAEFIKMLVSALKIEVPANGTLWYQPYVAAATQAGIYADDFKNSSWDKAIPRKEMSLLAVRAGITGYKQDYNINRNLYEATNAGILQGVGNGDVAPDASTSRAAAVTVIKRVLSVKTGKTLTSDKYATGAAEILWHKMNIQTALPRYFSDSQYGDIDTSILTSKSANGNVVCTVSSIVVINLDDPNDPNLSLVKNNDMSWLGGSKYYKVSESGGYAIVAISDITVKGTLPSEVFSCKVSVYNEDRYNIADGVTSPKNPNKMYGILRWDPSFEQPKFRVKSTDFKNGKYTFISGAIIPKGNFNSNKTFTLNYETLPVGNQTQTYELLVSKINTKYNQ